MSGIDESILNKAPPTEKPEVNWEYLFQPSEWYVTPELVQENWVALLGAVGIAFSAFLIFTLVRKMGLGSAWYKSLKSAQRLKLNDTLVYQLWSLMYIPLCLGSWLVWVYGGQEWNRALTVYCLHLVVNVLFAISLWWVKDLSLALLNLFTLIGVAMFTTSQFGSILYFASYINTPYLIFLLGYTAQFCYFWYLNEGKELLDITKQMKGGNSTGVSQKKKKGFMPPDVMKKRQEIVARQREERKKANKDE